MEQNAFIAPSLLSHKQTFVVNNYFNHIIRSVLIALSHSASLGLAADLQQNAKAEVVVSLHDMAGLVT